jgi:hypothetical protein
MKFLCYLGIHSFEEIKVTKVVEIIPIIFTSIVDAYGYGKCCRCGKRSRFFKDGEYYSLGKKRWRRKKRVDRRSFKTKVNWILRNFK